MIGRADQSGNSARRTIIKLGKKPSVILLSLALSMAGAQLSSLGGAEASAGKALSKPQRLERAKLGEAVAVRATGRGNPWINMADGRVDSKQELILFVPDMDLLTLKM